MCAQTHSVSLKNFN